MNTLFLCILIGAAIGVYKRKRTLQRRGLHPDAADAVDGFTVGGICGALAWLVFINAAQKLL